MFKPWLKRVLPAKVVDRLTAAPPTNWTSYAQEGEDMVLRRFFDQMTTPGFYVDVGAHHPEKFSNTFYFYRIGWRGINIDATPGSMDAFNSQRERDINIEAAISGDEQLLTYCIFNQPALNSFDVALSEQRDGQQGAKIIERVQVRTQRLRDVLDRHVPANQEIDFLTVDVEGFDLNVLRSSDWSRYRPRFVLVEDMSVANWTDIGTSQITGFMRENGYEPCGSTVHTIFYRRNERL